ncbi:MAG: hypothetical protein QOH90_39, partial [Actinomycetota bacterium]|nr:hypothetical protein [Actinomycetota bacterium]
DIGYNFVIARDGTVFEGRWARDYRPWETHDSENGAGKSVVGAHVEGFNTGSVGTSLMGNYTNAKLPARARASLVNLLAWEADRHDLNPERTHTYRNAETGRRKSLPYIAGHRDAGQTTCPGNTVYRDLNNIRHDVALQIGPGKLSTEVLLSPLRQKIRYGYNATVVGTLITEDGAPLATHEVTVYSKRFKKRWVVAARPTTDADGSFTLKLTKPESKTLVAVDYPGDETTWAGESPVGRVLVKPKVTLEASDPASVDENDLAHYPAGTTALPFDGTVAPPHPKEEVLVRVLKVKTNGERVLVAKLHPRLDASGSYRGTYMDPVPGKLYRFITWFLGDDDHEFSISGSVYAQVDPTAT